MKRIISYIISLLLLFSVLTTSNISGYAKSLVSTNTDAIPTGGDSSIYGQFPATKSSSCILMDATTGQIIYEKNSHAKMAPASITKIMTGYLAAQYGDLNSTITMSYDAVWSIDRSSNHIALDVDEEISTSDALYATMLMSANEAAYALGEQVSGSNEAFVQLMNDTAASLGCTDTHFTNPHGLPDQNHYTSAYDMALITKQALTNETFCEYAEETYYEIPPTNKQSETRYLTQTTQMMLANSGYYYPYCLGGKNGYTEESGGSLVTWCDMDGMKIICVTMGAVNNACNYEDAITLCKYVYSHFSYETPLEDFKFDAEEATRAQTFLNSYYHCENYGTMHLSVDTSLPVLFPYDGDKEQLEMYFEPNSDHLEEGIIGTLSVKYDGNAFLTLPVSYSGYVNSTDAAAIEEARKNGTLKPEYMYPEKDHTALIIGIVIGVIILLSLILRIRYVRQKAELERQKRARAMRRKELEENRRQGELRHKRREPKE